MKLTSEERDRLPDREEMLPVPSRGPRNLSAGRAAPAFRSAGNSLSRAEGRLQAGLAEKRLAAADVSGTPGDRAHDLPPVSRRQRFARSRMARSAQPGQAFGEAGRSRRRLLRIALPIG